MLHKKIAFFASGSGSNIENIVNYFRCKEISLEYLILCNKPDAFVLERAKTLNINTVVFDKDQLKTGAVLEILHEFKPDLIVLAGFLWLMPATIVTAFEGKIINIHPALLPNHGGKGMYGMHVHQAVVQNRETRTGITIHYVNQHYDEGKFILQADCPVEENDTPDDVARKVHVLEYKHFPEVIEQLIC